MVYFMPRLEITPIGVSYANLTDKIKETRGELKDKINFEELGVLRKTKKLTTKDLDNLKSNDY